VACFTSPRGTRKQKPPTDPRACIAGPLYTEVQVLCSHAQWSVTAAHSSLETLGKPRGTPAPDKAVAVRLSLPLAVPHPPMTPRPVRLPSVERTARTPGRRGSGFSLTAQLVRPGGYCAKQEI